VKNRRGVACVEFALVLPLFLIVFLGMVELGRGLMVQQVITNAARDASRWAATETLFNTRLEGQNIITMYLTNANIPTNDVVITYNPPDPTSVPVGKPVQVTRLQRKACSHNENSDC
jgi:Flp pilus assembly protein TadG